MIDSSMLPDFIVEAAEHLEEMESSLLRLEQDYEDFTKDVKREDDISLLLLEFTEPGNSNG